MSSHHDTDEPHEAGEQQVERDEQTEEPAHRGHTPLRSMSCH